MTNKIFLVFISLMLILPVCAQESSNKFVGDLIIATKLQTVPSVSEDLLSENLKLWELLPTDKKSLTRFIVDVKNEFFFGYKLTFSKVEGKNQYKLSFLPLGENFKIPRPPAFDYTHFKQKVLVKYPEEILLNEGDTLVLDLLENPKTGNKVQDLIKVTTTENSTDKYFENVEPKSFSISNINLKLNNYKIIVNEVAFDKESESTLEGHIIGFNFRDKGKFLLSAFPQDKHDFQKIGYIENNKMFFKNTTDSFEIVSNGNILPNKGKWMLWGKFYPLSEVKDKSQQLPVTTESYNTLDPPNPKPKVMVLKYINFDWN